MCARFSLKVAAKDSSIYKRSQKIIISDDKILKVKKRSATKIIYVFSDHFRTFLPSSAKHFLGVSAQTSLEVATKVFLKN